MTHPTDSGPIALAEHDFLFAGGHYEDTPSGKFLVGAMYAERYVPQECSQPYPVVMFHGGVQTGTNFLATPDGRRGWLHDFLRAGYAVYIVDQPERGRSGHAVEEASSPPLLRYSAELIEERFSASENAALWPQAVRHTGWPGSGRVGDPIFDQFYASQVQMLADRDEIERLCRDAGSALLDKIGPAILLTHSQSGPFGWLIADARPELTKAIVAAEPNGPPFYDVQFRGGDTQWYEYESQMARPYGITRQPLAFDPPLSSGATPTPTATPSPADPELTHGFVQAQPARRLPNLAGVPILILTAEASYHATYDHCTSEFLEQAGVAHDFVRLTDHALHGDGHMIMLEKNNHAVADLILQWLSQHQT
ncbi:MAG: alpha/beta fold hydrolase [Gammaproteobacteria bacterium]|nr:alpha/beta fold hydrolase [Gammaproteobacteria bacterium]